ncbi:transcription termination/antitermination factor NusG [Propionibacterium sp. oral taxon 192 str. F0372]|uniref:transcription termination/antitermination protein NusG n=1 Tax=Propionibacterium sp. oral taxon 192 TaxID=671222 RepID=UPI0003547232|nr:transcription termination/antitermination protein NusG [Propionibacterium sp. oral taxon 192]EPH07153.1 transcription termination/antitermination factor NusG [Propionibacterium sp. oral taxon 192 str. F0372]
MSTDSNEFEQEDRVEIDLNAAFGDTPETSDDAGINLDFADFDTEETTESGPELNLEVLADDDTGEQDSDVPEADEALEKALEELRADLRSKPGDWYVVHTYSGMENRVKQNIDARVVALNLEDYIFESLVPIEEAVEIRKGEKKNVTRTFMPSYVLVRMELTDESWSAVRHTASVTGFVGHANQPVPLSLEEVEGMLTPMVAARVAAESQAPAARRRKKIEVVDYAVGDSVTVVDGPFAGVHATLTEINLHNQRVKAMVEILGRETPVDLTFAQIQKVS